MKIWASNPSIIGPLIITSDFLKFSPLSTDKKYREQEGDVMKYVILSLAILTQACGSSTSAQNAQDAANAVSAPKAATPALGAAQTSTQTDTTALITELQRKVNYYSGASNRKLDLNNRFDCYKSGAKGAMILLESSHEGSQPWNVYEFFVSIEPGYESNFVDYVNQNYVDNVEDGMVNLLRDYSQQANSGLTIYMSNHAASFSGTLGETFSKCPLENWDLVPSVQGGDVAAAPCKVDAKNYPNTYNYMMQQILEDTVTLQVTKVFCPK